MRDYNVTVYNNFTDALVHFVLPSSFEPWSDEFLDLIDDFCDCRDISDYFLVSIELAGGF